MRDKYKEFQGSVQVRCVPPTDEYSPLKVRGKENLTSPVEIQFHFKLDASTSSAHAVQSRKGTYIYERDEGGVVSIVKKRNDLSTTTSKAPQLAARTRRQSQMNRSQLSNMPHNTQVRPLDSASDSASDSDYDSDNEAENFWTSKKKRKLNPKQEWENAAYSP